MDFQIGVTLLWIIYLMNGIKLVASQNYVTANLSQLLEGYDKSVRPPGDGPTNVQVDVYILSLGAISEKTMDFAVNMYIRQRWNDSRLASPNISYGEHGLSMTSEIDNLWLPDTFIKSDKKSEKSVITTLNAFLRVGHVGNITYSLRVTSTISCPMHLSHYPLDIQRCSILLESYGCYADELQLIWKPNGGFVETNDDIVLPEHYIDGIEEYNCTVSYSTGAFSCIAAKLVFRRNLNYHVMSLFIPSILTVLLSWLAFWIDKDSTPGRISLSLLTILTMQYQINASLAQLPKVSYIKLVDVWLTGCLFFVFCGFIEFTLVNTLALREKRNKARADKKLQIQAEKEANEHNSGMPKEEGANHSVLIANSPPHKGKEPTLKLSDKVDNYARFVFPLAFLLFNIILWAAYMTNRE